MKKLLLLFALMFCISAMWNEADARYNLSNRKAYNEIKVGDTIAIQGISDNANNGYRYIANGILQTSFTEQCVYTVEEGPADIRTGDPTVFFRQIAQDKYLGHNGLRGTPPTGQAATRLVSTPDSAYNFALYCAADSSSSWQGQRNFDAYSTVLCYSWVNDGATGYSYLCNWGYYEPEQIRIWSYTDTNPWDVYAVYETADIKGELSDLIEFYNSQDYEFIAGTDPGFYPEEYVNAYNNAIERATIATLEDHTDEEYSQYLNELKTAKENVENSYINITDGYYYIVSAYTNFLNSQKVEKACFVEDGNSYIQWKTFNPTDPAFIFHISKLDEETFQVQSFNTDRFWSSSSEDKNSQGILTSTKQEKAQIFNAIGGGQWQIWNEFSTKMYHPESNSSGSGKNGKLVTWNTSGRGSASTWYIRSLDDSKLIDSLNLAKEQNKLTNELNSLCTTAGTTYDKLFVYAVDTLMPLITNVSDTNPNDCQLSSNASDPSEGEYLSYLIDKDPATFWHSSYHSTNDPQTYHYLQADISNNPQTAFQIFMRRRDGTYGNYDRPTKVNIYAAQDTTGQWNGTANWQLVKTIAGMPTDANVYEYFTPGIEPGFPASYVRFEVVEKNYSSRNLNGFPYFNLSEFQIYPVTLSKDASQYYYSEAMQQAADALLAQLNSAKEKVNANIATQADIDELSAAIEAVNALYADTTQIKSLINTCQTLANSIVIGENIGQCPSEDLLETLRAAIETALNFNPGTGKLDKETIDQAYSELRAARFSFLNSLNLPKTDAWYYISSLDEQRSENSENYTNGGLIYVRGGYGEEKNVSWSLNEGEEMSYDPMAMWHFIPVEDEDYPLTYYVQNLGTGMYIGDYTTYSVPVLTSKTPVLYQLNISGGQPGLVARRGANPGYSLHAANADNNIVGWSAGAKSASAWDIVEVDQTIDAITLTTQTNSIDVFTVPYDFSDLNSLNDDVMTYAIKKMTHNPETDETTIDLYNKKDFQAGEPCVLVNGDPTLEESEQTTLVIAMPTTITSELINVSNGIVGLLTTEKTPENVVWFDGKGAKVSQATISAHTGYIDAAKYTGEVEGVETALTLTVKGMAWPTSVKGDVDGDGAINSSDVVSVNNFILNGAESGISLEAADVNGDGEVSTADIVAIYNIILSSSASSKTVVGTTDDQTNTP